MQFPVYITNRNRLTSTKRIVEFLQSIKGHTEILPIIIDNASTYPPLLDWYSLRPAEIRYLGFNGGPYHLFRHPGILDHAQHHHRFGTTHYAVTDSDLDISGCPYDFIDLLCDIYDDYNAQHMPNARLVKCGLSLEINDIPDAYPEAQTVRNWESQYWRNSIQCNFRGASRELFHAAVDTTFAVYTCEQSYGRAESIAPALRSGRPYIARHLPWYITPDLLAQPDSEELYYLRNSDQWMTHWTKYLIQKGFAK